MAEQDETSTVDASSSLTLGERLQEARQQKKFSEAEVAAQLRVTRDVITHLEAQRWDKLPARTYTRGYIYSYIKLLGLPHDEMLALFNSEYTEVSPELDLKQHVAEYERGRKLPWLAVVVTVLLAVVIWFAYQEWRRTLPDASNNTSEEISNNNSEGSIDGFSSSIVEPIVTPEEVDGESKELLEDELIDDVLEAENYQQDQMSDIETVIETAPELNMPVEQPIVASIDKLNISFSDDCWVKITDNSNNVLLSKTMSASQTIDMDVQLPLNIILGRASAAQLRLNGNQIELSPHTQRGIAKLTLGVES